jgi:hypothetical protein
MYRHLSDHELFRLIGVEPDNIEALKEVARRWRPKNKAA